MGKALTVFVTLAVVGIAVSALVDNGGFEKNVVRVCVRAGQRSGDAVEDFEPLRSLLARETRRPVNLVESGGDWPRGLDVYVMPVDEFFRWEAALEIVPIYEVVSSESPNDKAVVVARPSEGQHGLPSLRLEEVVFVHPMSVNGFWVQAAALAEEGGRRGAAGPAETLDTSVLEAQALAFEGASSDATRVICGVAVGAFLFGACKASEIADLARRGVIDPRELRVVLSRDRLPETVIAVEPREARYFGSKMARIAALLEDDSSVGDQRDSVRLLAAAGVRRLDRVDAGRIDEVRKLFERFGGLSGAAGRGGAAGGEDSAR